MTMVSQGSTQKPFVLDIASKVADLLNPQTRTFLIVSGRSNRARTSAVRQVPRG